VMSCTRKNSRYRMVKNGFVRGRCSVSSLLTCI